MFRLRRNTTRNKQTGCWLWHGYTTRNGYGQIYFKNKKELIHRVAANLFLGYDLNSKNIVLHRPTICFNKNCWNPRHLYIGSYSDNARDREEVTRKRKRILEANRANAKQA
jgi:hypothetical protein